MRKKSTFVPYLQILVIVLLLVSIPRGMKEKIQGMVIAMFAPIWEQGNLFKRSLHNLTQEKIEAGEGTIKYAAEEIDRLKLENQILINEIDKLFTILSQENLFEAQPRQFMTEKAIEGLKPLALVHQHDLQNLIKKELQAIPAQVIFRSLSLWSNSLWINVGKKDNEKIGRTVVARNSPVMSGVSLAGVVDYVGERQSRVRLITDSGLIPSVRAVRKTEGRVWYLAKGELRGSLHSDWRRQSLLLRGIGFNYDFPDEEGPSRDLRSGTPSEGSESPTIPIIEQGDLLITTGMDGTFPPGMLVAYVTRLISLKEGDYTYELEAISSANLNDLTLVFVLPPLGYNPFDQPPHVGR